MYNQYSPEEIKLAREIAQTLDDMHSLSYHLFLVRRHPESFLREKLAEALAVPDDEVMNNRAAIYISRINKRKGGRYGGPRY